METFARANPQLPIYASLPSVAAFAILLLLLLSKPGSKATYFLLIALWLRYVMSAFPIFSFARSPIGLSWNAVASIAVVASGLLVVRKRSIFDVSIFPIVLFCSIIAISAVLNHLLTDGIETVVKYSYLSVIILSFVDAAEDLGFETLLSRLLWIFVIPFTLQAESFILRLPKATELDGSLSYIGGYNHEAGFSVVLITGVLIVCLNQRLNALAKTFLMVIFGTGILLANYRTSMIAVFPLLVVTLLSGILSKFKVQQRVPVGIISSLVAVGLIVAALPLFADRFETLSVALSKGTELIKPPSQYTRDEAQIMSGRAILWSSYYYGWKDSKPIQHVFGIGPDSWEGVLPLYAHNTLVSILYEFGVAGVAAMLFLWAWMLVLALRIRASIMAPMAAAHVGFILLNQATMPLWMIEGLVFYGIACGSAAYWYKESRRVSLSTLPEPRHIFSYEDRSVGTDVVVRPWHKTNRLKQSSLKAIRRSD